MIDKRKKDMYDGFTYFAWFVIALMFLIVVALIVWLGSLPKQIALKRNHPQVESINACSWIGLAVGGIGWPIAFVWAFHRSVPTGIGGEEIARQSADSEEEIKALEKRIDYLKSQLKAQKTENG